MWTTCGDRCFPSPLTILIEITGGWSDFGQSAYPFKVESCMASSEREDERFRSRLHLPNDACQIEKR
jgi:hypothetical protein